MVAGGYSGRVTDGCWNLWEAIRMLTEGSGANGRLREIMAADGYGKSISSYTKLERLESECLKLESEYPITSRNIL